MKAPENNAPIKLALWRKKLRRLSDRSQLAALAPHASELHTYEWAESRELVKSVRPGEVVVCATARALGPTLKQGKHLLADILDKGGHVHVLDIDESTSTPRGAIEILDALRADLIGDSRALSHAEAREYGSRNGAAARAARTRDRVARKCWTNAKFHHMTSAELCATHPDMRGWSPMIAAKRLGPRGKPGGRPAGR